eukprot:scaffold3190_cov409-Prasinococcus_capsulatus_cf.AAC.3
MAQGAAREALVGVMEGQYAGLAEAPRVEVQTGEAKMGMVGATLAEGPHISQHSNGCEIHHSDLDRWVGP